MIDNKICALAFSDSKTCASNRTSDEMNARSNEQDKCPIRRVDSHYCFPRNTWELNFILKVYPFATIDEISTTKFFIYTYIKTVFTVHCINSLYRVIDTVLK